MIWLYISSSGNSQNMINAAKVCDKKIFLITHWFKRNNKLKPYGNLSIWIDSKSYIFVELAHHKS